MKNSEISCEMHSVSVDVADQAGEDFDAVRKILRNSIANARTSAKPERYGFRIKKFAFLPKKMSNGKWVFLGYYTIVGW